MGAYGQAYDRSLAAPEEFWGEAAALIDWSVAPEVVLDASHAPFYRWFPDGEMNTCFNAVDRHVNAGRGDQVAIEYVSPVTNTYISITYTQLLHDVALFAGVLRSLGVERGDRVIIYMPMIPQAMVAMLACARLGAVHSVVFGGFASAELSARIDDAQPRVIVTASCGIEINRIVEYKPLLDAALGMSEHSPESVVVFQRPQARATMSSLDVDWDTAMARAEPADPVPVGATDPLYILYTSGTTGRPKGIVRDNGGHAVAMAWSFRYVYGMNAGDVWWSASDVGWVVGHSYIVYAPLISGATTLVYEGKPVGTPDAGEFWRVIDRYQVRGLFTAPTAIRAIRKEDPDGSFIAATDTRSLEALFLAGERLDPDTYVWASTHLGVPVIDNWWQTETGWPIASQLRGLQQMPLKAGSPSVPVPGFHVRVLNADHEPVGPGVEGDIAIRLPMPPGTLPTLWGDDERYVAGYLSQHPGYYTSGDGGYFDSDGYIYVMGRTDDVINVAGHRLTTGSMEAIVTANPAVAECAVIGVYDPIKGQVPRAFVVLKAGAEIDPEVLQTQIVASVREKIGPVAALKDVCVVPALPKTRSGKILRRTMRGIAAGRDEPVPSTIEDPSVLDALTAVLRGEDQ
jgi:propionyl-CoA synthetase